MTQRRGAAGAEDRKNREGNTKELTGADSRQEAFKNARGQSCNRQNVRTFLPLLPTNLRWKVGEEYITRDKILLSPPDMCTAPKGMQSAPTLVTRPSDKAARQTAPAPLSRRGRGRSGRQVLTPRDTEPLHDKAGTKGVNTSAHDSLGR